MLLLYRGKDYTGSRTNDRLSGSGAPAGQTPGKLYEEMYRPVLLLAAFITNDTATGRRSGQFLRAHSDASVGANDISGYAAHSLREQRAAYSHAETHDNDLISIPRKGTHRNCPFFGNLQLSFLIAMSIAKTRCKIKGFRFLLSALKKGIVGKPKTLTIYSPL